MIVIFGWVKESAPVRPALDAYCWHCHKTSEWALWRETEWVTFFHIKTIPFLRKDSLVCSGCRDTIPLDRSRSALVAEGRGHPELAEFLESRQLAGKNEIQRNFLRAMRAQGRGDSLPEGAHGARETGGVR